MFAALVLAGCSSGPAGRSDGAPGSGGSAVGGAGAGGGTAGSAGDAAGGAGGTVGGGMAGTGDPSIPSVTVELWEFSIGSTTQLAPNIRMTNNGPRSLPMSDMAIRYWYTSEIGGATGVSQSLECFGTQGVVCGYFNASVAMVSPARPTADTYLVIDFSPAPAALSAGSAATILLHITRSDGGIYDQSNDYSYNASGSGFMNTDRITVYYKGTLVYGVEP